jgi:hypothetical protein
MTIQHKRSAVSGKAPTTAQLALGELAVNTTDGKIFLKKSVGGTESIIDLSMTVDATKNVGDFLLTYGNPDPSKYLQVVPGTVYAQSAFPELFSVLGYQSDNFSALSYLGKMPLENVAATSNAMRGRAVSPVDGKTYAIDASASGTTFRLLSSTDLVNWTVVNANLPAIDSGWPYFIILNNGTMVYMDYEYGHGYYSTNNGVSWAVTVGTSLMGDDGAISNVIGATCYANGKLVMFADYYTGSRRIWTTTDGINWTQQSASGATSASYGYPLLWTGQYFMTIYNNESYTSTDGLSWTKRGSTLISISAQQAATNGNGMIVVKSQFDDWVVSYDHGFTWEHLPRASYPSLPGGNQPGGGSSQSLMYCGIDADKHFLVIDIINGEYLYKKSYDGKNWLACGTQGTAPSPGWSGGTYGSKLLAADSLGNFYIGGRSYDLGTQFGLPTIKNPTALPKNAKLYIRAKPQS